MALLHLAWFLCVMRTKLLLVAFLAACGAQAAEFLDVDQLPEPVKNALKTSETKEPIREVRIRNVDGRTVYDVELNLENRPNAHVRISAEGKILSDSRRSERDETMTPAPIYPAYPVYPEYGYDITGPITRLRFDELPAAVQKTIKKEEEANDLKLGDITSERVNDRPAYRVEFRERGRNPRFYVAEDGTILRPVEKPPALGVGTTFMDTPEAVQKTIRAEIAEGEIVKIKKEDRGDAASSYRVDVRNGRESFYIEVSEDGRILADSRKGTSR